MSAAERRVSLTPKGAVVAQLVELERAKLAALDDQPLIVDVADEAWLFRAGSEITAVPSKTWHEARGKAATAMGVDLEGLECTKRPR